MKESNKNMAQGVMAFYHEDGLPAAWEHAMKFAGENGRIATMPDIVEARLASEPGEEPWKMYYTTLTAEYYGESKISGDMILIIAHGIGPMSTLDGIRKAYSWEYQDKTRNNSGGRITQEEFWDLEAGKYGEVSVIDFEKYCKRYEYPFIQTLSMSEALTDPVLNARLGPRALDYILVHAEHARKWHREQAGVDPENKYKFSEYNQYLNRRREQHLRDGAEISNPYIISLGEASNCGYYGTHDNCRITEKGYALAHLVSTGGLSNLHHEGNESLVLDVDCYEWWNGVRLIGIQVDSSMQSGIQKSPQAHTLLRKYWKELLIPLLPPTIKSVGFRPLLQIDDKWFTHYPKAGERMDSWEPEYLVTSMKNVGKPVLFRTTVGGYYGFYKYGINEVEAIAPPHANAYAFEELPQIEYSDGNPTHHIAMIQFYSIEVDKTKRVMRIEKLRHDYKRLMALEAKEVA